MALIGEMQYLTIGGKTYSLPAGGDGTVTSVAVSNATNGGLSVSGSPISSSGTITIGHSNVLAAAQTTQAVYPIKIDKNGHISEYGNAVTIPTVNDATFTIQKNGANVETFSANAASNKTANIVVNEVPSGGTSGQVLTKHSATNYDVEWADASAGAFIVTFTYDDANDSWSCDKTAQEIYAAYQSGSIVIGYEIYENNEDYEYYGYAYCLYECSMEGDEPYARFARTLSSEQGQTVESSVFQVNSSGVTTEFSVLNILPPFVAQYGITRWAEVKYAYDSGATVICTIGDGNIRKSLQLNQFDDTDDTYFFACEESDGYRWASIAIDNTWNQGVVNFALSSEVPTKTSDLTNDSGFITTETDPVFSASAAAGITSTNITNWNNKVTDVEVDGTSVVTGGVAEISIPQEIFIAEYNFTSFNAVNNAYMSGQTIICHYDIDDVPGYAPLIDVIDLGGVATDFVFIGFSNAALNGVPFQYVYLHRSQGWDSFLGEMAFYDHTHGNITNDGDITATATIASGDRLIINDESASKVTNSSITFGTSTSQYLANNGTWQNVPSVPTKTSDLTNDSGFINSIKTINNQSLIGSGDITVSTTAAQIIRWTEST